MMCNFVKQTKGAAGRAINNALRMLAPFQFIEYETERFSKNDFREGQESFYFFIVGMYEKMAEDLDFFAIPSKKYDDYILSNPGVPKRGEGHGSDAKESRLRNAFEQAIHFYPLFFYEVGSAANSIGGDCSLILSAPDYEEVLKKLTKPHLRNEKEKRFAALASLGVGIEASGDAVTIRAGNKMLLGLWTLCKARNGAYKLLNYLRADYTGTLRGAPEFEEILKTLHEDNVEKLKRIKEFLDSVSPAFTFTVKPISDTTFSKWKAEFKLKGKNYFGFYSGPDTLSLGVYFGNSENISATAKLLEETDAELFTWYRGLYPERYCSFPYNKTVELGGEKRRICGMSNKAEINGPNDSDVEKTIKLIKAFRAI